MNETPQMNERWLVRVRGKIRDFTILEFSQHADWVHVRDQNWWERWEAFREIQWLEQLPTTPQEVILARTDEEDDG
jgi:hypothetical protein